MVLRSHPLPPTNLQASNTLSKQHQVAQHKKKLRKQMTITVFLLFFNNLFREKRKSSSNFLLSYITCPLTLPQWCISFNRPSFQSIISNMRQGRQKTPKDYSSQSCCMSPTSSWKIKVIVFICCVFKYTLYTKQGLASIIQSHQISMKLSTFGNKKIAVYNLRDMTETSTGTRLHAKWDPY